MKKLLKATFAIALSSMLLFSCSKSENVTAPDDDNLVQVTIIAGNPQVNPGTKTEINGTTPYWSVGDAIGVSDGSSTNYKFTTGITSATAIAEFTGTTSVSSSLYAYYPYTSNGVGEITDVSATGAKVDIPAEQNPTATSFDGKADVMVAKQFTINPASTKVSGLKFKRLGAVVKIVLKDNTTGSVLSDQHPSFVSMTTSEDGDKLAGRAVVNFSDQSLSEIYHNGVNKVTANYTSSTHFLIDDENAAYLVVYPRNLASGTTLTIKASTENYSIEKAITVPASGINLTAGKITTLNVGIADAQIKASIGASLPFTDDFSWQTATSGNLTSVDSKYSAFSAAYADMGANTVRLGTGSSTGYLVTEELNLSSAFYVKVSAYAYNESDGSKIEVVVDGTTTKIADDALTSTTADYIFNLDAATNKSKVKITTDKKRAILTNLQIISGTYVFPPSIKVTSANPMSVASSASTGNAITYTIANPTTATLTATTTASWISNIDYSTSGTVTFDVAAQESNASARSGVITLKYTNASDVEVTINQAAAASATKISTILADNTITSSNTVNYELDGVTVMAAQGKNYVIGDATGVMLMYYNGSLTVGSQYRVSGAVKLYNGVHEFNGPTVESSTGTAPAYGTPEEMTVSSLTSYASAPITKYAIVKITAPESGSVGSDGTNSVNVYDGTGTLSTFAGKNIKITGYLIGYYSSKINILATNIVEDTSSPIIKSIEFTYASHSGWTVSSGAQDKGSYYLLKNSSYIDSPSFSFKSITSIAVTLRSFGGTQYGPINIKYGDTVIGSQNSATSTLKEYTINVSSPSEGTGSLRFIGQNTTTDNGPGISKIVIYYTE